MNKIFIFSLCFFMFAGASPLFPEGDETLKMGYVARDLEGEERWQADTEIRKKVLLALVLSKRE